MKIWITGYIGSGKSTISKQFDNVFEFDCIEIFLKEKGYNLKNITKRSFKSIVAKELAEMNNIIIEGIQCCDYYKKGDKIYFVKTSFIKSIKRSYKRDGLKKIVRHCFDNFILTFKLKVLYIKALLNNDIIFDIKKLNKHMRSG